MLELSSLVDELLVSSVDDDVLDFVTDDELVSLALSSLELLFMTAKPTTAADAMIATAPIPKNNASFFFILLV